ncbi:MAG: hypothetical protein ACMUIG_09005, partial [Thermoplasmatota archaeon]
KHMRITRWIVRIACLAAVAAAAVLVVDAAAKVWFIIIIIFLYAMFYLFIFIKNVEKVAMFVDVAPEKLTEGDWIAKDYFDGKKKICGPKDLGIEKKQIKKLIAMKKKGKIKKVKIKLGIPFVPSFLIAYVITLALGAWWMFLF